MLRFTAISFDVAFSLGCTSDRLRYYNGHDDSNSVFLDYCGDTLPLIPASESNVVTFKFHTVTNRLTRRGFQIVYNTTTRSMQLLNQSRKSFGESLMLWSGKVS